MKTVSSTKVGVETSAGGKKIARPDPKAGGRDILLLPYLNQEVDVGQTKPSGIIEGDTKILKVDKNPEGGPKNIVVNVGKSGSVSSKGSVSKKSDEEEDLVDFEVEEEDDKKSKKIACRNVERCAKNC